MSGIRMWIARNGDGGWMDTFVGYEGRGVVIVVIYCGEMGQYHSCTSNQKNFCSNLQTWHYLGELAGVIRTGS